jgi:hypothetical protein
MTRDVARPSTPWTRAEPQSARTVSNELELTVAFAVAFLMAVRYRLPHEIPISYVVAVALLPVSVSALWRYRGAFTLALLSVAAAVSGLVLTVNASGLGQTDTGLASIHTGQVLGIPLVGMTLLWARSVIGTRNTVFMYSLGMFASLTLAGINAANPWKFSFSVPVVLLVLSLPRVYRQRLVEILVLLGLATFSVLNDSRSAAAQMLIAAVLLLAQGARRRGRSPRSRGKATTVLIRIGVLMLASIYLLQQAIVEGTVGSKVQERTIQQIDNSGSLLLGGRPEVGATAKLLKDQFWGYGSGTLASHHNFQMALDGMTALGYDPDGRYIQVYMLNRGFEVHSFAGDLWINFGLLGLVLAVALGLYLVFGIARTMSDRVATGVLLYLALRSTWDLAFSPMISTMDTLPLTLAVILAMAPEHRTSPTSWLRSRFAGRAGSVGRRSRPSR